MARLVTPPSFHDMTSAKNMMLKQSRKPAAASSTGTAGNTHRFR
mgnify:CR=1 FL=1